MYPPTPTPTPNPITPTPTSTTHILQGIKQAEDDWLAAANTFHICMQQEPPGGRLNKKEGLTRYGDSHVKDKTS